LSLADTFAAWRNGLIASPKFQAWAVRNPFTRPVARQKARATFDLVAGFVYSQTLAAAAESGLLDLAREAPVDATGLAQHADLPLDGAERLLRAAAALTLLRRRADGRYALGDAGAALLGNPSVFAMIRHHKAFYRDIAEPLTLLKARRPDTELSQFWAYQSGADPKDAAAYSALMAETQALIAENVLGAYDFRRHRRVMDVGGGLGAFLSAVGAAHSGLSLVLADLPPVARLAEARLAESPIRPRLTIAPLDMFQDPVPVGADLITLIRVVHDHDDGPVRQLLAAIRKALPPGGSLLIAEPMAGVAGAETMADAYFGLYLWAMGRGAPRRPEELSALLREAGFRRIRHLRTAQPMLVSAIIAR
jgi:demethylspheroidene O-methyltransferase